jgi:hypothetical protein
MLFFSTMNKYNDKVDTMLIAALMAGVGAFLMVCVFLTSLHNFLYPLTCLLRMIE